MGPGSRNAAAIAAYGYSREEFLTLSAADIRPPDDVEPDSHHGETATLRHQLKSGEVFLVQTTAQPVEWKGLRAEFFTVRDVSRAVALEQERDALLQREASLRRAAESAAEQLA